MALALLAGAPVLAVDARVDQVRQQAAHALQSRDPIAAEVPLRAAIRAGVPADAVRALLGEALLARGDAAEARKVLWGGNFTPDSAGQGWRIRGQLELVQGRLAAAGQAFDQALRFTPDDADLWTQIASLRFSGGEQAQAIEAAARAVQLDPRNPRALAMRGMLIREQFGLAAALPWFEAALHVLPDDPALLGEYAATLGDMGQYRAMLVVCRKLAEVDPKNPRPLYLQAVLAARAGKTDLARAILLRTGTAFRDMPAAMLLTGVLEYRAGNLNLAIEQLDRLVRVQPDNLQARQLLARALARQGDWRQLARRFDGDARQPYASPYMLTLVGQAWQRVGQKQAGAAYLARASAPQLRGALALMTDAPLAVAAVRYQDAPGIADNAVPFARALLAAGQGDAAQDVADRLRDANPGTAEANLLSGDVRLARGDAAHALIDYSNGAAIRFNEPVMRRMDAALRAMGRDADANAMTSRYLAQNPGSLAAMKILAAAWSGPHGPTMVAALAARGQAVAVP
ncbi:MAG: hypothetical protein RIS94_2487 [Pseudomonadota bacterium]